MAREDIFLKRAGFTLNLKNFRNRKSAKVKYEKGISDRSKVMDFAVVLLCFFYWT